MKLKTTNQWIQDFVAFRNYLNLVDKSTQKPIVNVGRDVAYAVARTAKKVKDDIELLEEKQKKLNEDRQKLDADVVANVDGSKESLEAFLKTSQDEWRELLEREIEVEVHAIKQTDLPAEANLPQAFFETLVEMTE